MPVAVVGNQAGPTSLGTLLDLSIESPQDGPMNSHAELAMGYAVSRPVGVTWPEPATDCLLTTGDFDTISLLKEKSLRRLLKNVVQVTLS